MYTAPMHPDAIIRFATPTYHAPMANPSTHPHATHVFRAPNADHTTALPPRQKAEHQASAQPVPAMTYALYPTRSHHLTLPRRDLDVLDSASTHTHINTRLYLSLCDTTSTYALQKLGF